MDKKRKHILLLNSKDRSSGTSDDAIYHMNESELHECTYVALKDVVIPNTIYNIFSENNKLDYNINGIPKQITIPEGFYDTFSLITKLNTLQPDIVFANNATTRKFDITSTNPSFLLISSTIANVIGLTATGTPSTSYSCDKFYNLNRTNYIHIISSKLAESDNLFCSNNKRYSVIASIPVLYGFGFILNLQENKDTADDNRLISHVNLSTIDLKLVDDNFKPVSLNGSNWSISFSVIRS
jgi:hypothetical protein